MTIDLVGRLQEMGLIDEQLISRADISRYDVSGPEDRYPVCGLRLTGIARRLEADLVTIRVSIGGEEVKRAEVPVLSGETHNLRVVLGDDIPRAYAGKEAECTVLVTDKYGRRLVDSSSMVRFGGSPPEPKVVGKVDFRTSVRVDADTLSAEIASGTVSSDAPSAVCLEMLSEGTSLWQSNIALDGVSDSPFSVVLGSDSLSGPDTRRFTFRVTCNGRVVLSEDSEVSFIRPQPVPRTDIPGIVADLSVPDLVDTHTAENGTVRIGTLVLFNKGPETDVVVNVRLDGSNLLLARTHIFGDGKEVPLTAPFTAVARPETSARELVASVVDMNGDVVLHSTVTLRVRSRYEMDLSEVRLRSAQFVNPRSTAVGRIVRDSSGPLADVMEGGFSVTGYQHGGRDVYRQVKAVYDMLHASGMRYVNDTFSFTGSGHSYQHVRSPDLVWEHRSGNCLELSILFASILEAMGLEAVIAFPPGHAIVGVVLSTDRYTSMARYTETEEVPFHTLDIGGKRADVLFVETTACPWDDDFVDAACLAYNALDEHLKLLCDADRFVFVKEMRLNGTDPILGL